MSPELESFHALAAPMIARKYQPNPLRITFHWKLAPQLGFRRAFQPSLSGYIVWSRLVAGWAYTLMPTASVQLYGV